MEGEGVFQSIFQAYTEHRKRHRKMNEFEYLDRTPYLHSSDYQRFEVNDKEYRWYYSLYEHFAKYNMRGKRK